MRKTTLAGLSTFLAYVIVVALRYAAVPIPFALSPLFAGLFLAPILMLPLTLVNKRLLAWRKVRGRDIAEEEKYEHDGIISLRPRE